MSEDDSLSTFSGSDDGTDDKAKKKVQNSVRWKRWWLKNRDKYNEKRRLSAQLRSAKNKAERAKTATNKDGASSSPSGSKRQRRSNVPDKLVLSRESSMTGSPKSTLTEDTPVFSMGAIPPSISPALQMASGRSGSSALQMLPSTFNSVMMGQVPGAQLAWQQASQQPIFAYSPAQMSHYVYQMPQQQQMTPAGMMFARQFLSQQQQQQSGFAAGTSQMMQHSNHASLMNPVMMGHQ